MATRKKAIIIGGALAAVGAVALGAAALYYTIAAHDAPARASLNDPLTLAIVEVSDGYAATIEIGIDRTAPASPSGPGAPGGPPPGAPRPRGG